MSRPQPLSVHGWLSLAAPLLVVLGFVAMAQRQGSDQLQALPAILVGLGLVISAVVGRRRRRHRLLMALRSSRTDPSMSDSAR